jgi:hypothetical protein
MTCSRRTQPAVLHFGQNPPGVTYRCLSAHAARSSGSVSPRSAPVESRADSSSAASSGVASLADCRPHRTLATMTTTQPRATPTARSTRASSATKSGLLSPQTELIRALWDVVVTLQRRGLLLRRSHRGHVRGQARLARQIGTSRISPVRDRQGRPGAGERPPRTGWSLSRRPGSLSPERVTRLYRCRRTDR